MLATSDRRRFSRVIRELVAAEDSELTREMRRLAAEGRRLTALIHELEDALVANDALWQELAAELLAAQGPDTEPPPSER